MKTYETSTTLPPPESPLAVKAIGSAVGLSVGSLLLCIVLGVPFETSCRLSIGIGAMCLIVAGAGAFRRVASYTLGQIETMTRLDLNQDGRIGPDIRLVPVRGGSTIGVNSGINVEDLRYMLSRLDYKNQRGWTVREWIGQQLPSGRLISGIDDPIYVEFISILEKTGSLVERTERSKGRLLATGEEIIRGINL